MKRQNSFVATGAALCLGIVMAGCGSDGGSSTSDPVALTGTAAIGAPVANGAVELRCASGQPVSATANALGVYQVLQSAMTAKGAAFPCAVKVSGNAGGQPVTLFSFAEQAGRANVTPLTDLAVAHMVNAVSGVTPVAWFGAQQLALPTQAQIQTARNAVQTAVAAAANQQTLPFDIFTQQFAADGVSTYDVWLDKLNEALVDAGQNYGQLVTAFVSGSDLGNLTIHIDATPITGGGGTLTVTVSVSGVAAPATVVNGVPKPASSDEFCGNQEFRQYISSANTNGAASLTFKGCQFSGNTGSISAEVAITSPISMTIPYVATYVWN